MSCVFSFLASALLTYVRMRIPRNIQLRPGCTLHMCWRCSDHENLSLLERDAVKDLLLACMGEYKDSYGVEIYDYAIMDNHAHTILKIRGVKEYAAFLQAAHTAFARRANIMLGRSGQFIKDLVKIMLLEDEQALVNCQAYLHLNRWSCALRVPPEEYRHCGYAFYAKGEENPLLAVSPGFLALGTNDAERRLAFIEIVRGRMAEGKAQETAAVVKQLDNAPLFMGSKEYVARESKAVRAVVREHKRHLRAQKPSAPEEIEKKRTVGSTSKKS